MLVRPRRRRVRETEELTLLLRCRARRVLHRRLCRPLEVVPPALIPVRVRFRRRSIRAVRAREEPHALRRRRPVVPIRAVVNALRVPH